MALVEIISFCGPVFSKALKFYMHDVTVQPDRADTWAAMALARKSRLENKLNAVTSYFVACWLILWSAVTTNFAHRLLGRCIKQTSAGSCGDLFTIHGPLLMI